MFFSRFFYQGVMVKKVQPVTPLREITNVALIHKHSINRSKIPLQHKIEIGEEYKNAKLSVSARDIANKYHNVYPSLSHSTVLSYAENVEDYKKKLTSSGGRVIYREKEAKHPTLNEALARWLMEVDQNKKFILTYEIIRNVTIKIYDKLGIPEEERLQISDRWIGDQLKLLGIEYENFHGESGSIPKALVLTEVERLARICIYYKEMGVKICDIINIDETAFIYQALPTGGLTGQHRSGFKISKERITVAMVCNAVGEYFDPIFISTSLNHACFGRKPASAYGIKFFYANANAWMTNDIFSDYLARMNARFVAENRKVLVFLDNFSGHKITEEFSNIKLIFFTANMTPFVQPCDAGIIYTAKSIYRRLFLGRNIDSIFEQKFADNFYKISRLDAILLFLEAVKLIKTSTYINCFKKIQWLAQYFDQDTDSTIRALNAQASESQILEEEIMLQAELEVYQETAAAQGQQGLVLDAKKYAEIDDYIALQNPVTVEELTAEVKREFKAKEVQKKVEDSQLRTSRTQFLFDALANVEEAFKDAGVAMKPSWISGLKRAQACLKRKLDVKRRNL